MIISVVERNHLVDDPYLRDRYIGAPCQSFDEARELCAAHLFRGNDLHVVEYIDGGVTYAETSWETGEIIKEFFVRQIH